jgi:hypothetical protein
MVSSSSIPGLAIPSRASSSSSALNKFQYLFSLLWVLFCIYLGICCPSADQASDSEIPPGYVPTALLAKYYGNMYNDQEEANVEKRTPVLDNEEGQHIPRYIQKRTHSNENRYWNLLRALEEELALEGMARQGIEDDETIANEAEPVDDVHKVDKRRRRYGFWVTAINKMGK